jgi:hypothetical protein
MDDNFTNAIPKLAKEDIPMLARGTKGPDAMLTNCTSSIELFRLHHAKPISSNISLSQMLPGIWYLGSQIEIISPPNTPDMLQYSASKCAFAKYARAYYDDQDLLHRNIFPADFQSSMGKGLVSADWAAAVTMFFVRRGVRCIPATYTGMDGLFKLMSVYKVRAGEDREGGLWEVRFFLILLSDQIGSWRFLVMN